jgi:hypothetical protein
MARRRSKTGIRCGRRYPAPLAASGKMAIRLAILLSVACGILPVAGPPSSSKASNTIVEAPMIDQLLESLCVSGPTRLGRLARAPLAPPSECGVLDVVPSHFALIILFFKIRGSTNCKRTPPRPHPGFTPPPRLPSTGLPFAWLSPARLPTTHSSPPRSASARRPPASVSVAARSAAARPSVSRTAAGRLPVARQPGNPAAARPAAKRPVAARPAAAHPMLEELLRSFAFTGFRLMGKGGPSCPTLQNEGNKSNA